MHLFLRGLRYPASQVQIQRRRLTKSVAVTPAALISLGGSWGTARCLQIAGLQTSNVRVDAGGSGRLRFQFEPGSVML